jgi:hypothetical protein
MKSDAEEGFPVAGADEADTRAVEKWGRSLSFGAAERRTVKGGRTAAVIHFERNWLHGTGREGEEKGGSMGVSVWRWEKERGDPVQQSAAWGGRQRPLAGGRGRWRYCAYRGERRGAANAVRERLISGARRQRGPRVSGGVQERVRECGAARRWALSAGPGSTAPLGSVLNRFKNIQAVPKKFEFLQTLAGSKDIFSCSKKLK